MFVSVGSLPGLEFSGWPPIHHVRPLGIRDLQSMLGLEGDSGERIDPSDRAAESAPVDHDRGPGPGEHIEAGIVRPKIGPGQLARPVPLLEKAFDHLDAGERLARDVPAFASYLIKALRASTPQAAGGAAQGGAAVGGAADGQQRSEEDSEASKPVTKSRMSSIVST